jgi:hypothetical protein
MNFVKSGSGSDGEIGASFGEFCEICGRFWYILPLMRCCFYGTAAHLFPISRVSAMRIRYDHKKKPDADCRQWYGIS